MNVIKSLLLNHVSINIRKFKCDYKECDQTFVTSDLKSHFNNNHKTNKTFKCIYNECNQRFIKS